jgi:hypothetical protein
MMREAWIVPLTWELTPWSTKIFSKIQKYCHISSKTGGEKGGILRILNGIIVAYYNQLVHTLIADD